MNVAWHRIHARDIFVVLNLHIAVAGCLPSGSLSLSLVHQSSAFNQPPRHSVFHSTTPVFSSSPFIFWTCILLLTSALRWILLFHLFAHLRESCLSRRRSTPAVTPSSSSIAASTSHAFELSRPSSSLLVSVQALSKHPGVSQLPATEKEDLSVNTRDDVLGFRRATTEYLV